MADMFDADDTMVDEAKPAEEMSKADICALALLQATNDFVEALQQISFPHGRDAETELDRALNCIAWMQNVAHEVLRKHGFQPRGEPI